MLQAVFFDLDGTLCAPSAPFAEVFTRCCVPLLSGSRHHKAADLLDSFGTALTRPGPSSAASCLHCALGVCRATGVDTAGITESAAALTREWARAQRLLPGATATLRALAESLPLGLITNGPSDMQRAVVAHLDIVPLVRWIVVSGDDSVGVRKPDPAIFRHALALAQCSPEHALYVGDSATSDVAGAASAAMRTCWLNPSGQPLPPGVPEPDLQVSSIGELSVMCAVEARMLPGSGQSPATTKR